MPSQASRILIGTSGWRYEPWRGVFYPEGLQQARELEYLSRCLPSLELNGSFYSLQYPASYAAWHDATPAGFVFAVKGSRYITHMLKLKGVERPLANFFASGVLNLKEKLGPFLWQLPPALRFDEARLDGFLRLLPRDTEEALALARRRDARMKGRSRLAIDRCRRLRHALEIRHPSFVDARFVALLRRHGVGLVVADTAGRWPLHEDVTADFVYLRLHGDKELYASGYTPAALERWAGRIRAWSAGSQPQNARLITGAGFKLLRARDVYCYFDNDAKVHAPFDALNLAGRLGLDVPVPKRRKPITVRAEVRLEWPAAGPRAAAG